MLSAQTSARSLKLILGSLAVASICVVTASVTTFAQQNLSESADQMALTAIPPRIGDDNSLLLQPGEKKQVELRVINSSNQSISIQSLATDFIIEEDGSTPVPIDTADADNRWSLASWLTVTPNGVTLAPQETKALTVLIEVPEDALPGGHYAMITHQPTSVSIESADNVNEQTTGVNQRVGTLLYVIVDGPINEQAFIRDFTVPSFMEYGPVPFSFVVENESDIHIQPQIGVVITNLFGQKVADMQPDTKNIFPFTNRSFEGQWDRIWGFGRYKAEVVMTYGTTNELAVANTYFWLLPVKLIVAILVGILILILAIMSIRRHMLHNKQDQSQKIAELETKLQQLESEKLKKFEE